MFFVVLAFFSFLHSCGNDSFVICKDPGKDSSSSCVQMTEDELSMYYLQNEKYELAQTILEKKIGEEPEAYFRYPRLASVYARRSGFEILNFLETGSSGTSLMASLGTFLPKVEREDRDGYRVKVDFMSKAKKLIEGMPEAERSSGQSFYGSSAKIQLTMYASAYPVMYMRQFAVSDGGAGVDLDILQTMTLDDVSNVLEGLVQAGTYAGEVDPVLGSQVQTLLQSISGSNLGDSRSNLMEFLKTNQ